MKKYSGINTIFAITIVLCICFALSLFNSFMFFGDKAESITLPQKRADSNKASEYDDTFINSIDLTKNKLELTTQNVGNVIMTLNRPNKYSFSVTKKLYYGDDSRTTKISVYVVGDYSKIELLNRDNTVYKHYIFDENSVFIWYDGEKTYYKGNKGNFSTDSAAQIQTYEDIVNVPPEQINTVSYVIYQEKPCIYAEVTDPETGYLTKYWISTENGLLIRSDCYDSDGAQAYSAEIDAISTDNFSNDVFILPDGKLAYTLEESNDVNKNN